MPAPRATKAVIQNAIQAAQKCGISVGEVHIGADGTVKIVAMEAVEALPSPTEGDAWDKATGAVS